MGSTDLVLMQHHILVGSISEREGLMKVASCLSSMCNSGTKGCSYMYVYFT